MIFSILPYKESYSEESSGAIALTVENFIKTSDNPEETIVITGKKPNKPNTPKFITCNSKGIFSFSRTKKYCEEILKIIKNYPDAILEIHNRPSYVEFFRKRCKNKIILYLHNDPNEIKLLKSVALRERALKNSDHIICVSQYIKNELTKDIKNDELINKSSVIYNINNKYYEKKEKKNQIIFVGRLTEEKGVIELCQALDHFFAKDNEWTSLIIAHYSNTTDKDKSSATLNNLIEKYPSKVRHISRCSNQEVLEHFSESKIAILPSKWNEPFGLTVLEAINTECALISSNRGGIPEIVKDAGILLDEITGQSIYQAIANLTSSQEDIIKYQKKSSDRALAFSEIKPQELLKSLRDRLKNKPTKI
ncbi:glycosyltransferase family 4 protein [Nitrincola tapanii]|nr:glycosyltransferase family 4 protein [Nitrincola tapanii]